MADHADLLYRHRGVDERDACPRCNGWGRTMYSSGSTWRGGMGTCGIAWDVCDQCWGSGDITRPGMDLRALTEKRADWENEQAAAFLARRLGINFLEVRRVVLDLATLCDERSRKRKADFFERRTWESLARTLRDLVKRT